MKPIKILQLGAWLDEELAARLAPKFLVLPLWKQGDSNGYLREHGADIRAILTHTGAVPTDPRLLEQLPQLKVVVNLGAGCESIDLVRTQQLGIPVLSGVGANAPDVAELAIGLILAVGRDMLKSDAAIRAGQWMQALVPTQRRVSGKALGLLGIGLIGEAIAKRAIAFDMSVSYCARTRVDRLPYRYVPDLAQLAEAVDFLVVAVPGGPLTHHMVDARVLSALGPQGILVNIARGSVVDEHALIRALRDGRLGGAGLDVFEHEPTVPKELRESDRVVLLPHRGGVTIEAFQAVVEQAVANLARHFPD